jgi:RNA polymerase sigma-70 factor (ECF subfamily)
MSTGEREYSAPVTNPEIWVAEYGDLLFRYALRRVRRWDVAEELVQETFLAALHSREVFQARSSEKTWLLSILKHKIVDHIRKASRESSVSSEMPLEDIPEHLFDQGGRWAIKPSRWGSDPGKVLEAKGFWDALMSCMEELPSRMAHAFALREIEQMDVEEVSEVMEVTPNNLGVLLYRARQRLRRCLELNWFS